MVFNQFEHMDQYTVALTRIFHELTSRDSETGNPLVRLSGAQQARIRCFCDRATAGSRIRGVLEQYVAGS